MHKIIIVCLSILLHTILHSTTIGSDTSPSRHNTQVILFNADRIAGFAALTAGFQVFGSESNAIFDSFMEVSGKIDLLTGTLTLQRDLITSDTSTFNTLGNIVGNNHLFDLTASITCIPIQGIRQADCNALLLTQFSNVRGVNSIDWSYDDQYLVAGFISSGGATNILSIFRWNGTTLTQLLTTPLTVYQTIEMARWHPSQFWFALARNVTASNEIVIYGFNTGTNTITLLSGLNFTTDVYSCSWHPNGNILAVAKNPTGGVPEITIHSVNGSGVINATPLDSIQFQNIVAAPSSRRISPKAFVWNDAGTALAVGTEGSAGLPELFVFDFNQTTSLFTNKTTPLTFTFGNRVNALDWNPVTTNLFAIGFNGNNPLRLMRYTQNVSLTQVFSVNPTMGNPKPNSLHWSSNGMCLASGWTNGSLRLYTLYPPNPPTDYVLSGTENVVTQPATGQEINTVRWTKSGNYLAIGSKNSVIYMYGTNATIQECSTFSNIRIGLNGDVTIKNCCIIFNGQSTIDGRGHRLILEPTCNIGINSNASLLFKDIIVEGIQNNIIENLDSSSTMSFENAQWILDANYSFTQGHLNIIKNFDLFGENYAFIYQSNGTSTIYADGSLNIHHDLLFRYQPASMQQNLITLLNQTSKISLYGGILSASTAGLQLTKGTLIIDNHSLLSADSEYATNGIILGDGSNAANNIALHLYPAATLDTEGAINFNNV